MNKTIRALRWLSAAAAIVLTALLCWQCIELYIAGNAPDNLDGGVHITPVYSVEKVAQRWEIIALPAWVCIGVMAAALVVSWMLPPEKEKLAPDAEHVRMMLVSRIAPEDYPDAAMEERRNRRRHVQMAAYPAALVLFPAMFYLYDRSNFTSWDLESVMGSTMLRLIPGAVVFVALMSLAWYLMDKSYRRENELLRPVRKGGQTRFWVQKSRVPLTAVRIALLAVAAVCIIDGVSNGGMWDVLVKAINICTECIGLG